jgi:hypothetical protein
MKFKSALSLFTAACALMVAAFVAPAGPAAATDGAINFDGPTLGIPAEQIVMNGVSFSSPFAPNSWQTASAFGYRSLTRNVLKATNCSAALIIETATPTGTFSFRYGISASAAGLIVDAWMGEPGAGTLVSSQNLPGASLGAPDGVREGTASASTNGFDHLVIYSPGGCAAIDQLTLSGSPFSRLPAGDIVLVPLPQIPQPIPLPPVLDQPIVVRGN